MFQGLLFRKLNTFKELYLKEKCFKEVCFEVIDQNVNFLKVPYSLYIETLWILRTNTNLKEYITLIPILRSFFKETYFKLVCFKEIRLNDISFKKIFNKEIRFKEMLLKEL